MDLHTFIFQDVPHSILLVFRLIQTASFINLTYLKHLQVNKSLKHTLVNIFD